MAMVKSAKKAGARLVCKLHLLRTLYTKAKMG